MTMSAARKLKSALEDLVGEGSISADQAELVRDRFATAPEVESSRKNILAEIAGYLGGAFLVIAIGIITAGQWDSFTEVQRTLVFGFLAIALFALGLYVGSDTEAKGRLSGVLYGFAAISTTATIAIVNPQNEAPTLAFLGGTTIALIGYYLVRSFVGHFVMFGFIFIAGIIAISDFTNEGSNYAILIAIYFLILGSAWLAATYFKFVDEILGYLFAGGALFIATQILFFDTEQLVSYPAMIFVAAICAWLYLRVHSWPLVLAAVITTTVGVGEFVSETLGGSLGSALGLFAAGAALVTSSLLALRTRRENRAIAE